MDLKNVNESFISECRELLESIDSILKKMKEGGDSSSEVENIKMFFHAIHTIKRSASMYEFTHLESFTDNLERLLIKVKDGEVDFDKNLSDMLLECKEHLTLLVDLAESSSEPDEELLKSEKNLAHRLFALLPATDAAGSDAAFSEADSSGENESGKSVLISMDSARLDKLVNLVGELVISSANISQTAHSHGYEEIMESADQLSQLVGDMRDSALQLRMVPIGSVFSRFRKTVHDISKDVNKNVNLEIRGAETELDKSITEKISAPMMHLIRYAIEHGIETADKRIAAGKEGAGKIVLDAYHETGEVIIEVSDDGVGLNKDSIISKGVLLGLIKSNQALKDDDAYKLLFTPEFSAQESGRGAGLVNAFKSIESLRGKIEVKSKENDGTTMRIRLPLTLAIIDGFLVRSGDSSFVVPLDMVAECLELSEVKMWSKTQNILNVRGEALPYIKIKEVFGFEDEGSIRESEDEDSIKESEDEDSIKESEDEDSIRENVVIIRHAEKKAGLIVDELLGEVQSVIKPLGRVLGKTKGVSGSTILGDGKVAMILDVMSLMEVMGEREEERKHQSLMQNEENGEGDDDLDDSESSSDESEDATELEEVVTG